MYTVTSHRLDVPGQRPTLRELSQSCVRLDLCRELGDEVEEGPIPKARARGGEGEMGTGPSLPLPQAQACWVTPETLYHRDDALLYIAYVMLIWAAPIPADRWHCSLWP